MQLARSFAINADTDVQIRLGNLDIFSFLTDF